MKNQSTDVSNEKFSNPLVSFRSEMNDFFDRFAREIFPSTELSGFTPKIEVKDKGSSYVICAELPGMKQEDISITLQDNALILEGEKKSEQTKEDKGYYRSEISYGSFYRAIPLGTDVNLESVSADYSDGVLQIKMEKTEDKSTRAKKIAVGKGGSDKGEEKRSSKH